MQVKLVLNPLVLICALFSAPCEATEQEGEDGVCKADQSYDATHACYQEQIAQDGIARDIRKVCPIVDGPFTVPALWSLSLLRKPVRFLQMLGLWPAGVSQDNWADDYTAVSYLVVVRIMLGLYKSRDKDWIKVPGSQSDRSDLLTVGSIQAPHFDVDGTPNFYWFESIVPTFLLKHLYTPVLTCFYSALRRLSTDTGKLSGKFDDALDDSTLNTWDAVLKGSPHKTKFDWVMAFYDGVTSWDGKPLWPNQMTNFQTYWKQDEWDDRLEYAIAFHLIGAHRVEAGKFQFENIPGRDALELPFRLSLNVFSKFEIRKHFGRYGGDLYFNEDGLPVVLQTPDGRNVMRGDKDWQYWKFVWRSTLVTAVTLIDHLHMTHFRVANVLSRTTRSAMRPDHPFRRICSIFTFGSIFVNMQAMHTLVGPKHLLHRATPFKDFTEFANWIPSAENGAIADIPKHHGIQELIDDKAWEALHPKLKATPYFADGRLIMQALLKMIQSVVHHTKDLMCDEKDAVREDFLQMQADIVNTTLEGGYQLGKEAQKHYSSCTQFADMCVQRLTAYMFVVTAWHRQVGFVGDYYGDPSLATMAWKEGEAFGRPRQHMIMTIINVFTSTHQPLLKEDYSHLFKGMRPNREEEFVALWRSFMKDLQEIEVEIDKRNGKREIKNINGSPKILESAVSK